MFTTVATL